MLSLSRKIVVAIKNIPVLSPKNRVESKPISH
jgi:hypothetical protein